ncbi:MAG TPA: M12 family metallo-peptidase [Gemmatimonadaceae bacterium]|nr:M12 family metallo-peptidase [Gemmatimonadaceae bacterium]
MRLSALARIRALATTLAAVGLLASAGCSTDNKIAPTSPSTGALAITVSGLPSGASASVVVTGPGSYSQVLAHSTTISDLAPGTYQLTASPVASHDTSYAPTPTAATLAVAADAAPAAATVVYARSSAGTTTLDLSIGAMYITQSTQTLAGTVPLVQNRDGYLRVFVVANQSNNVTPQVRVRFYVNGALQGSPTIIAAPSHAVPTSIAEGTLASSWNMSVPGSMIKPGLAILADVDPAQAIPEARRDNNSFPASGTPLALTVKNLPTFYLRFVPVRQSVNNLTGVVSSANKDALLTQTVKIHPISSYSADVHATYTTNALALTGSNANGAWTAVLGEILALRTAEGSQRNYFGIVKTSYQSGIEGISYIGAGASVGYDGSSAVDVVAHELGHSWGRSHSPCGVNGGTDPSFPYPSGNIGVYGFDVATKTLYPPAMADVMSYCHPQWISDYTYKGVYNFRAGHPTAADVVSADLQPCIIVWGHIANGVVELEPSFEVLTHPSLPARGGAYALRALDATGAQLFALSFDGDSVADAPSAARSFAYAIPLARATRPIASMVLAGPHGSARRESASATSTATAGDRALGDATPATARRVGSGAAIAWNAQRYPLVVVRDAKTGEVLSLARGGATTVETAASDLELTLSDGVRSTVLRSHVGP